MIIRSQNKLKTTTDLNLEIYDCHDDIFLIVNQTVDKLGIYSTKEKAIKVLDMICNFANDKHYEKVVTEQCGCIGGVVFEMPQDSEV